uniref:Uncharacterized protein n=1 Tax=Arundo donax TaxID=35708 RepID=A0A0A9FPT1_ARUDO
MHGYSWLRLMLPASSATRECHRS